MLSSSRAAARKALKSAISSNGGLQYSTNAYVSSGMAASSIASTSRMPASSSSQAFSRSLHTSVPVYHPSSSSPRNFIQSHNSKEADPEERTIPQFNVRMTPAAAKDTESIQRWLSEAFPSFPFPDDVALQMITHESWDQGKLAGHNRRLAFLGRRAMKFFMNLFLAQHSGNESLQTTEKIDELLHTSILGDHVGRALRLGEVMRWTPAVNDGQRGAKETGLFKIRGVTVEALVGGLYHQHGALAAKSFFLSRILPDLKTFSQEDSERLQNAIASEKEQGDAYLQSRSSLSGASKINASSPSTTSSSISTGPFDSSEATVRSSSVRQPRRRSSTGANAGVSFALEEETSKSSNLDAQQRAS